MKILVFALIAPTFLASLLLTMWARSVAMATGVIDTPNERSSHAIPTPRGGGVAIVASSLIGIGILTAAGVVSIHLFVAIAGGGVAVALVGLLDDYRALPARARLAVHLIAAGWAVFWSDPTGFLLAGGHLALPKMLGGAVSAVGIAWFLNIFNFMDGIDGIAASEAAFVCGAAGLLAGCIDGVGLVAVALILAAASLGFLVWNWPPARVFMGDVGSGYIGFVLGVMAVFEVNLSFEKIWMWFVLCGIFVVDSTITLARRFWRREALATAHRMHAYQHAAARFGHGRVTAAALAINVLWLLPLAAVSALWVNHGMLVTVAALVPLGGLAVLLGAGQSTVASSTLAGVLGLRQKSSP